MDTLIATFNNRLMKDLNDSVNEAYRNFDCSQRLYSLCLYQIMS